VLRLDSFTNPLTCSRCIVDGEGAARYIKSTNSKNTNTPIIAVSAYSGTDPNDTSNVFTASLAKPLQKADLIGKRSFGSNCGSLFNAFPSAVMRQLGFKTSTLQGGAAHPKVTASRGVLT
jgi:serine/threonine-protein kinase RIM15